MLSVRIVGVPHPCFPQLFFTKDNTRTLLRPTASNSPTGKTAMDTVSVMVDQYKIELGPKSGGLKVLNKSTYQLYENGEEMSSSDRCAIQRILFAFERGDDQIAIDVLPERVLFKYLSYVSLLEISVRLKVVDVDLSDGNARINKLEEDVRALRLEAKKNTLSLTLDNRSVQALCSALAANALARGNVTHVVLDSKGNKVHDLTPLVKLLGQCPRLSEIFITNTPVENALANGLSVSGAFPHLKSLRLYTNFCDSKCVSLMEAVCIHGGCLFVVTNHNHGAGSCVFQGISVSSLFEILSKDQKRVYPLTSLCVHVDKAYALVELLKQPRRLPNLEKLVFVAGQFTDYEANEIAGLILKQKKLKEFDFTGAYHDSFVTVLVDLLG